MSNGGQYIRDQVRDAVETAIARGWDVPRIAAHYGLRLEQVTLAVDRMNRINAEPDRRCVMCLQELAPTCRIDKCFECKPRKVSA
jgi:hypothetical protein